MPATNSTESHNIIKDCRMRKKLCVFFFYQAKEANIEKLLLHMSNNKPPGTDNLTVNYPELKPNISPCHIFSKCLEYGVSLEICHSVIPLPKDIKIHLFWYQ